MKKPQDSNVLRGEGQFDAQTVNNLDYIEGKGDRFEAKKPHSSDHWKTSGHMEQESVSKHDYLANNLNYVEAAGGRFEAKKPHSSDCWKTSGHMEQESVSKHDYTAKTGERYDLKRPTDSNTLKGQGKFSTHTVNSTDYVAYDVDGRQSPVRRPHDNEIFARDETVGSFAHQIDKKAPPQAIKGERYEARRPRTSDIWKV